MRTTLLILAVAMVPQERFTFEPEGKAYRVEMPSRPTSTSNRDVTNASGRSRLTTAQSKVRDAIYSIQVTETRGKVDPGTLDEGIRRYAEANKATLGAVATITVDGNPGREFETTERVDGASKRSKLRWVVAGHSLFLLSVAGKPGDALPGDADRFLGSLEIGPPREVAARPKADAGEVAATDVGLIGAELKPAPKATEKGKAAAKPPAAEVAVDDDPDEGKSMPAPKGSEKGKAASRSPARVTIGRFPRDAKPYPADDLEDLPRSFMTRDRDGFRDLGPSGSVLVGVRVSYIERFGGPKVRSAQPIYRSGTSHYPGRVHGEVVGPVTTVVAKPGYAVGGLVTHTGLTVDGFRMVFMRVDGDRLDPDDTYNSPWIGDTQGGGPGEVTSKGGLVVGLQGRAGAEVFALGLTSLR